MHDEFEVAISDENDYPLAMLGLAYVCLREDASKILTALEEKINLIDNMPAKAARIYDGMVILQQLPNGLETFGEVSEVVLKRSTENDSEHVFFITDQYWNHSIKSCERNRRATTGSIRMTASRPDQKIPVQTRRSSLTFC